MVVCGAAFLALASLSMAPASAAEPRVYDARELSQNPTLRSHVEPTYPIALRAQGLEGAVTVEFVVLPDGKVDSPRIVGDAHPLFAAAALAAVAQWTFQPGRVGNEPVATKVSAPIRFALKPGDPGSIKIAIGPLTPTRNMRSGERGVVIHIQAEGAGGADVRAGRIFLTKAEDDTGAVLKQGETPAFHHTGVGRSAGDNAEVSSAQPISISLMGLGKEAKFVKLFEGKLELFVPSLDPDATFVAERIASQWGTPLSSEALKKAGVTLVVFDKATADKMAAAKTPGGPQEYDSGTMFATDDLDAGTQAHAKAMSEARQHMYASLSPALAAKLLPPNEMKHTDVAVGWRDPEHRIIGVEFQGADGSPLHYNHNGRYHSKRHDKHKGFDIYELPVPRPPDARLVCWLLTEYSVVPSPLNLTDLPLPPPPAAPAITAPATSKPADLAPSVK